MFLIDDILLAPVNGLMYVFREVHKAATEALAEEGEHIRASLSELYLRLESGEITEAEFDAREKVLLDRLDELEAQVTQVAQDSEQADTDEEPDEDEE